MGGKPVRSSESPPEDKAFYGEPWTISMRGSMGTLLVGSLADHGECRWGESIQRQRGVIPWNLVDGMGMRK